MTRSRIAVAFFLLVFLSGTAVAPAQPKPPTGTPCCWPPVPAGMVDWWTFDEPVGPASSDFGGKANNSGTDHGPVTRVTGEVGRAASFDSIQEWIEVANANEVNFTGDCSNDVAEPATIDLWIRTKQTTGTVTVLDKRISTGSNFVRGYSLYLWNGRIGFQMATGPGNLSCNSAGSACSNFTATTLPSVADGQWHLIAVAFTRCKGAKGMFYVDGQTAPFTPRVGDISNASTLFIGRRVPSLGPNFFRGEVDELEFFKSALDKQQLDSIFQKKCAGKCRFY